MPITQLSPHPAALDPNTLADGQLEQAFRTALQLNARDLGGRAAERARLFTWADAASRTEAALRVAAAD